MRGVRRAEVVAIGIDLALKEVGLVAVPSDWSGDWSRCVALHHSSDPLELATLASNKIQRIERIVLDVKDFVLRHAHMGVKCRVAVENYAYDRFNAATLAEVGGALKLELWRAGYLVQPVMMQTARKWALTRVPRDRGMKVKDYVRTRLTAAGMPRTWSMDVGDAWVVANYVLADYPGASLILPEAPAPGPAAAPEKKPRRKNRRALGR